MRSNLSKQHYPADKQIDFLFVTYGGGHVKMVLPIAEKLLKDGYSVYIFALTTAINTLKHTSVPYFSYKDLPYAKNLDVIRQGKILMKTIEHNNFVEETETISYLGINFLDLEKQIGKIETIKLWKKGGRQFFYPINTMRNLLKDLRPNFVISTNSPRSEKAAIDAARLENIKSVCLCDLLVIPESEWLKNNDFADFLFVIDDRVKKMLVSKGRNKDQIKVTGNPAFDSINDNQNILKAKKYKIDNGLLGPNINILYASSPEPKMHPFTNEPGDKNLPNKIEKVLRDFVSVNKDFNLILRRHPSQNQEITEGERIYKSSLDIDFNIMVHVPDLIIQVASTIGMQAIIANKLLLNVDCSIFTNDTPYTKMGFGTGINSLNKLPTAILDTLSNNSLKKEYKPTQDALKNVTKELKKIYDTYS